MKRRRLLCQARCSEQFMSQFLAAKILLLILANGNSSKCSRRSQMSLFPLTNGTQHSSSGRNVRRCCVVTGPDGSAVIMMVSVWLWWLWLRGMFTHSPLQPIQWHDTSSYRIIPHPPHGHNPIDVWPNLVNVFIIEGNFLAHVERFRVNPIKISPREAKV